MYYSNREEILEPLHAIIEFAGKQCILSTKEVICWEQVIR